MKNKTIILLLLFLPLLANAQTKSAFPYTVRGTVTDAATGKPLPGVNINLAGISSAITEDDGSYSIGVPKRSVILEVEGYGYASREISVQGRDSINISLYEQDYKGAKGLALTPFGEKSSILTANSYSLIRENSILSTALTPDALIQNFAGGVNTVFRSGIPAGGANMFIHGFNTMNAGSMPLIVLDGLPFENSAYATSIVGNYVANPLAAIDVKDIESITVLKDGTSLYGAKGGNGVILIRTLRAKQLETKINAHLHTGVNFQPERYPVLNAAEHRTLITDLLQSANLSSSYIESLPFINRDLPVQQPWGYEGNVDYYRYNNETDWQKPIWQSKWNQDFYLNVAGGDEISTYVLSLGYLDQTGTIANTRYQRFNTRFNSEVKLSKRVLFLANMGFVYGNRDMSNDGPYKNLNPILASVVKSPFTASHIYNEVGNISPNEEPADVFGNSNPYVLANDIMLKETNYRFMGSFQLEWNINDKLYLAGLFGLNYNKEREKAFYPSVGVYFDPLNNYIITNEMQHRTDRLFSLYGDAHIDWRNRIASDHRLDASIGMRYQNNRAEDDYGQGYNSSSDDFKSIGYGNSLLRQIGGSIGKWNWLSVYGTADYIFQNKYFLNASVSADASSRYGMDAPNLIPYYSAAAAWLISGEDFMKETGINPLKLRVSYGLSGNDDIGNYNGIQYYKPQNLFGTYGLIRGNLVNPKLRPETVERINAGLDASFFNERLNLSIDAYSNTVSDMILITTPDRVSGFDRYITNAGKMRNQGIDLKINGRIINSAFKWDLGLLVSIYNNKVLDLNGEEFLSEACGATIQTKVGQPLGQFYGYETAGVYSTQADANADGLHILQGLVPVAFSAGDVRFVDQNGDKLIDENDRVVIGDPNPDFFGSLNNTFKYRGISLEALLVYSLGNDVYNYARSQMESLSTLDNQSQATINRWRREGDVTSYPRAVYGDPMGNSRFSDRWIEDGSYIRLKSVTLAYDLNFKWKMIRNCTLFATGENLLTLTKYKGLDPEFSFGQSPLYYGIDPCVTPMPRTVSVGLRLSL
ncbi:MAG: SusC/RagA family TonB-linked outer membrane protein [Dysgonamonadaceae bacterium]|nr:SusC/RagA family TonB-linked outer membrane protein [Dysgonamonadaceae bacterium]